MRLRIAALILGTLLLGFLSGRVLPGARRTAASRLSWPGWQRPAVPSVPSLAPATMVSPDRLGLDSEEVQNVDIFRKASASVVNITSIAAVQDFFSLDVREIPQGTGSGFIWDGDGHIVTNFHVIESGDAFQVTLSDQSTYEGRVVGAAPNRDLAVLRIRVPGSKLAALPIGRSQDLLVGQKVLAIGNPFGLDHSLTVGVISALNRQITSPGGRTIRDMIQTDAAINPGNSGGPLLDSHGRLIGVNSAIVSPSGAYAGIGFAVPGDTVVRLVPQLIARGKPIEAGIGVDIRDEITQRLGLKGALIFRVKRGSPAESAGLEGMIRGRSGNIRLGDRIVAVNGQPIESGDDLYHAFDAIGVGGTAHLTVVREGHKREVTLKLVELG